MKIALLTRLPTYYSERRLQEEAQKRSHELELVQYARCYIGLDKDQATVRYDGHAFEELDAIIPRVANSSVAHGTAVARQLEVSGIYTTAPSIAISRSFDRLRVLQLLQRTGVNVPKTIFCANAEELEALLGDFNFPVVIKPLSMQQGGETVLAESGRTVTVIMNALNKDASFLVQECLSEKSVDISAFVVGGTVIASVKRANITQSSSENRETTSARLTAEEDRMVVRAARAVGLSMCSVQFIRTANGPFALSVNATPSIEVFEKTTKRNVAEKVIEYIQLNAKRRNKKDRVGA